MLVQDVNILRNTMLDTQSVSSDAYSMGSSKYLKTHAFSPSVDQEKGKVSALAFTPSNSKQKNWPLLEVRFSTCLVLYGNDSWFNP